MLISANISSCAANGRQGRLECTILKQCHKHVALRIKYCNIYEIFTEYNPLVLQGLAVSTFQVVLVPTLVGVIANEFFHDVVKKFTAWLPLVGVAITTLLCASPCAQVATVLR